MSCHNVKGWEVKKIEKKKVERDKNNLRASLFDILGKKPTDGEKKHIER